MELNTIKEPINKKIGNALNLINNLRKQSKDEIIVIKPRQVNFVIDKDKLNDEEIKSFIDTYRKLYEGNANTFQNTFLNNNFMCKHFIKILNEMSNNLRIFESINNEKIKYETFDNPYIGLDKNQITDMKEKISKDLLSYKENERKIMKEYKWRNIELLDIIIEYLNCLSLIMNNINELTQTIPKYIIEFGKDNIKKKFLNENTIKEGKYIISDLYRLNLKLLDEIDELFSKVEKIEERRIENPFNKLKNLLENLKKKYDNTCNKINEIRTNYNQIKKIFNFKLDFKELDNINKDCINLAEKMKEIHKIVKEGYQIMKLKENKFRLDILIILDITSSMESFIEKFKEQFYPMLENIRKECPEALLYVGFIGYKDLNDLELGDDYINVDLTTDYEKINEIINNIEPDGGGDIPEDIAGAFELSLKKSWKANTKITFLITDSPCHGKEYHDLDQNQKEETDKYIDENPNGKKIKDLITEIFGKNISLFCLNLHKNTNKMFDKFKEIYEETKLFPSKNQFFIENNNFYDKEIITKIVDLYKKEK